MAANWEAADWTKTNAEIAADLGVSRTRVAQKRATIGVVLRPDWAAGLSRNAWAAARLHGLTPESIRASTDEALLGLHLIGPSVLAELRGAR